MADETVAALRAERDALAAQLAEVEAQRASPVEAKVVADLEKRLADTYLIVDTLAARLAEAEAQRDEADRAQKISHDLAMDNGAAYQAAIAERDALAKLLRQAADMLTPFSCNCDDIGNCEANGGMDCKYGSARAILARIEAALSQAEMRKPAPT